MKIKFMAGDKIVHDEFGPGEILSAVESLPGRYRVQFLDTIRIIQNTNNHVHLINGVASAKVTRERISEEAHKSSAYSRYEPDLHDGDFADVLEIEPELVAFLDAFCIDRGIMKIDCNPSYEAEAVRQLKAAGAPELVRYLQIGKSGGEESHGFWINIYIPNPDVPDIDKRLRMFFNPRLLLTKGVYQLSKLSYNRRLLGKVTMHGAPEDETTEDLVLDS